MNNFKKIVSLTLVAVFALAMGSMCAAEEAGTIKMGFIGPLTGAAAVYGNSCLQGVQIAVDEINAQGGV